MRSITSLPIIATQVLGPIMRHELASLTTYGVIARQDNEFMHWLNTQNWLPRFYFESSFTEAIRSGKRPWQS